MNVILEDTSKFILCPGNWIKIIFKSENKVNRFRETLFNMSIISNDDKIYLKMTTRFT